MTTDKPDESSIVTNMGIWKLQEDICEASAIMSASTLLRGWKTVEANWTSTDHVLVDSDSPTCGLQEVSRRRLVNVADDTELKGVSSKKGYWRRKLPPSSVNILNEWMLSPRHIAHPYPSDEDKQILLKETGMSSKQLTTWFTNARKRIWKPLMKRISRSSDKLGGYRRPEKWTRHKNPNEVELRAFHRQQNRKNCEGIGLLGIEPLHSQQQRIASEICHASRQSAVSDCAYDGYYPPCPKPQLLPRLEVHGENISRTTSCMRHNILPPIATLILPRIPNNSIAQPLSIGHQRMSIQDVLAFCSHS